MTAVSCIFKVKDFESTVCICCLHLCALSAPASSTTQTLLKLLQSRLPMTSLTFSFYLFLTYYFLNYKSSKRGTWVAQSVNHPTPDFGSGSWSQGCGIKSGPEMDMEPASILSLLFPLTFTTPPSPHLITLSLKENKVIKKLTGGGEKSHNQYRNVYMPWLCTLIFLIWLPYPFPSRYPLPTVWHICSQPPPFLYTIYIF